MLKTRGKTVPDGNWGLIGSEVERDQLNLRFAGKEMGHNGKTGGTKSKGLKRELVGCREEKKDTVGYY